ncbi:MAG: LacI family transcriptional regulator [bacterium]|nr:LacI family transcriptional regulator [bacterium]
MSNVTLKDVAEEAGVSLSTASLVLNGKGQISQDVRDRVLETAGKLEYVKPVYTPSNAVKPIRHIAILVYEDYEKAFVWNFFRRIIIQLEAIITKERYYPVIIPVSIDQNPHEVLEKVIFSKVGGLFSIDFGNQDLFQQLEERDVPVVVINNSDFQSRFFTVCTDNFQGAYEGAMHLLELGHRHLAYVEYHRSDGPSVVNDRFIGFKKALDESDLEFPEDYRVTVDLFDMDRLERRLRKIFENTDVPTAIFAHDDCLAARIIVALQHLQINVPKDVSIIAPGDTLDYNQPFIPRITTMRINNELMGKLAGEMLLDRLKKQAHDQHVLKVNQQLMKRGSCRAIQ